MPKKNYRSFTGVKGFDYGILDADETKIVGTAPESVEFLQNISIETAQELVKAFGDNKVAEMAVGTGTTNLSTTFHKLPIEDKKALFGLKDIGGLVGLTNNPNPPYVACVFARTAEDGGTEYIGFTKGMFMMPNVEGQTKEESVEFGNEEVSGEFMSRKTATSGDEEVTFLIGYDAKGETTQRDLLYMEIFGVAHPNATPAVPGV